MLQLPIIRNYRSGRIIGWRFWLSGNALTSINVVALRQTRLVLG